jgi:hypothetical protein
MAVASRQHTLTCGEVRMIGNENGDDTRASNTLPVMGKYVLAVVVAIAIIFVLLEAIDKYL